MLFEIVESINYVFSVEVFPSLHLGHNKALQLFLIYPVSKLATPVKASLLKCGLSGHVLLYYLFWFQISEDDPTHFVK